MNIFVLRNKDNGMYLHNDLEKMSFDFTEAKMFSSMTELVDFFNGRSGISRSDYYFVEFTVQVSGTYNH